MSQTERKTKQSPALKPTKQRFFDKNIFAFDIETTNDNKEIYCISLVGTYIDQTNKYTKSKGQQTYERVYFNKDDFIQDILNKPFFRNSVMFATNLSFDFFGIFFNHTDSQHFHTLFRGSNLLFAKTYFCKDEYGNPSFTAESKTKTDKQRKQILFLDSMNYASLSVEKMGNIIGRPKLEKPQALGRTPLNEHEKQELIRYNINDSWVTYDFMKFFINSVEKLGGTFKNTIASTSMALFKNQFLKNIYYQPSESVLQEQFLSYYGGRTECLTRGVCENMNYYDFNSLYPSVMRDNEFPDPNYLRITKENSLRYIETYEGISDVEIYIPEDTKTPLLPCKHDKKLIFPTGTLRGWYTHIELREALQNGAKIITTYKTHYFIRTCNPFKDYVNTLYDLRLQFKAEGSPMELITKLFLNSLYGKFGQRFTDRDNIIHESLMTETEIKKYSSIERLGDYFRVKKSFTRPSNFCVPIWASYITAFARIKLHRAMVIADPVYVDTDSLITAKELPTSNLLGDLKLEMRLEKGIFIRPKMYACIDANDKQYIKIKGFSKRLNFTEFLELIEIKKGDYTKFTKFKEALRRNLLPNQLMYVEKRFSLEDSKREWKNEFNPLVSETSKPLNIDILQKQKEIILIQKQKIQYANARDTIIKDLHNTIDNDLFDFNSKGFDISKQEFFENEIQELN